MQAANIDEVLHCLDTIIQDSTLKPSRAGYFACLYHKMTTAVKERIQQGLFEDAARMENLDVIFANRYLAAYTAYTTQQKTSASWQVAFEAAAANKCTVMQHLLLGVNAHINLDLSIATAQVSSGANIQAMQKDYNIINDIISSLLNKVQSCLEHIWFPMRFLDRIDNKDEDAVINFSICLARKEAWNNAVILSGTESTEWEKVIQQTDREIATLGERIINPGFFLSLLLSWIRVSESSSIGKNMNYLNE